MLQRTTVNVRRRRVPYDAHSGILADLIDIGIIVACDRFRRPESGKVP